MTTGGMPNTPPVMPLLSITLTLLTTISVRRKNRSNGRIGQLFGLLDTKFQLTRRDQIARQVVPALPGSLRFIYTSCSCCARSTRTAKGCRRWSTTRMWCRSGTVTLPMQMFLDRRCQRTRETSSISRHQSTRCNRRGHNWWDRH